MAEIIPQMINIDDALIAEKARKLGKKMYEKAKELVKTLKAKSMLDVKKEEPKEE